MSACKGCGKELSPSNWQQARVIKTEPGRYFQGPRRTWHLTSPGVEAYLVDDVLWCAACYAQTAKA